jgi:hypothetical protein
MTFTATLPLAYLRAFADASEPQDPSTYTFETIGIALPSGLLGLGGGRWLIEDQSSGRTAAILSRAAPWTVLLRDETVPRSFDTHRRVIVLESATEERAKALASAINGPELF